MTKTEEFIKEHTRILVNSFDEEEQWLTPDEARKAVEIAREEALQEVKSELLYMLNTSIDNEHFFEQLDDYIEELKTDDER